MPLAPSLIEPNALALLQLFDVLRAAPNVDEDIHAAGIRCDEPEAFVGENSSRCRLPLSSSRPPSSFETRRGDDRCAPARVLYYKENPGTRSGRQLLEAESVSCDLRSEDRPHIGEIWKPDCSASGDDVERRHGDIVGAHARDRHGAGAGERKGSFHLLHLALRKPKNIGRIAAV